MLKQVGADLVLRVTRVDSDAEKTRLLNDNLKEVGWLLLNEKGEGAVKARFDHR